MNSDNTEFSVNTRTLQASEYPTSLTGIQLVVMFVVGYLVCPLWGLMLARSLHVNMASYLWVAQGVISVFWVAVVVWLNVRLGWKAFQYCTGLNISNNKAWIASQVAIGLVTSLIMMLVSWGLTWLPHGAIKLPYAIHTWWALLLVIGISPFIEELVFRGLLQSYLTQHRGVIWAIVATSICFTVFHSGYMHMPYVSLYVATQSLLLGWIRYKAQSLWPCIIAHSLHNVLVIYG